MTYSRIVTVAGLMLMAACAPKQPGFDGSYRLAGIDGEKVPANATLQIAGNQISGQGPCNAYNAQNRAAWPGVDLSPIVVILGLQFLQWFLVPTLMRLGGVGLGRM